MKCFICQSELAAIRFDHRDNSIRPCYTCEEVIWDTLADYDRERRDEEFVVALTEPLEEFIAS